MAANHTYPLIEHARIIGGAILQTHDNWCRIFDPQPGPCSCAVIDFKVVRARPARKARRG
jgi:hypothetical protein